MYNIIYDICIGSDTIYIDYLIIIHSSLNKCTRGTYNTIVHFNHLFIYLFLFPVIFAYLIL